MRYFIAVMAALLISAAWAIDPPKPQTPPTPAPPAPEQADSPVPAAERPDITEAEGQTAAEPEDEEVLPPLPADSVPAGPPPARFNPTEKVRADFPVSFPIDI